MIKTKIEYGELNWNPISGCKHDCWYCFAKGIANRFGLPQEDNYNHYVAEGYEGVPEAADYLMQRLEDERNPYPYGFAPTFFERRIQEPLRFKKPSRVLVSFMGDLFGEWIPKEWIEKVIEMTKLAYWHTYLFLTKNPRRYLEFKFPKNCWLGETITGLEPDPDATISHGKLSDGNIEFVSFEPLMGNSLPIINCFDWIIIGGLSGYKYKRNDETVNEIIQKAREYNIPIFLKDNLKYPEIIKEYPSAKQ